MLASAYRRTSAPGGGGGSDSAVLDAKAEFGILTNGTDQHDRLASAITAAVAAGMVLQLPPSPGGSIGIGDDALDGQHDGLRIVGAGAGRTMLKQLSDNVPIIRSGGQAVAVEDMRLAYANTQPSSNTEANALELYKPFMASYRRLAMETVGRGVYLPQVDAGGGTNNVFSTVFDTIKVNGYSLSSFNIQSFNSYSTGSIFENIYTQNNPAGTILACAESAFLLAFMDEVVIDQLNIEWCQLGANGLHLSQVLVATVGGLHFEQVSYSGNGDRGLVRAYDHSKVDVRAMTACFSTFAGTGNRAMFRLGLNAEARVRGLNVHDNTVTAVAHPVVTFDDGAQGCTVEIDGFTDVGEFTSLTAADSPTSPQAKRIGATTFNPVPFFDDTFAGTDAAELSTRMGEVGVGPWVQHTSYTGATKQFVLKRHRTHGGTAIGLYYATDAPVSADYDVTVAMYRVDSSGPNNGPAGRIDPAANTFYFARWETSGQITLLKSIAGTSTQIGSFTFPTAMPSFASKETRSITLRMRGTTISVLLEGRQVISVTDSSITVAGKAGMRIGPATDSTGYHVARFTALDAPVA